MAFQPGVETNIITRIETDLEARSTRIRELAARIGRNPSDQTCGLEPPNNNVYCGKWSVFINQPGSRSRGSCCADGLSPLSRPYFLHVPHSGLQGSDALCRALFGLGLVGPLPLAPGEAAGWVQPETAEEEEGQGRRRQRQQQQQQAKGSQRPDDSADGGSDGGGGGPGEGDRGVGNDVVLKAEVVCVESGSTLG